MRKRIMTVVLVVVMAASMVAMAIPAFAADVPSAKYELPGKDDINAALDGDGNGVLECDGATITIKNLPESDREHQIGMKPRWDGEGYVEFKFNAAKAGEYDLTLGFTAAYAPDLKRTADLSVNGGEKTVLDVASVYGENTDWNMIFEAALGKVKLAAGENTIRFSVTEDYDGVTVKNINVSYIVLAGEGITAPEAEAPETEAPETEAPETEAPETEAPEEPSDDGKEPDQAPQTGFATVALAIAAIGSGAYVVSKKNH